MDFFKVQKNIVDEYKQYIQSFINIKNNDIRNSVEEAILSGKLWPDPLIQFNPAFEPGPSVETLVKDGSLHTDMNYIFKGFNLYKHQVEAIKLGTSGKDVVVTSGTGSGKSLVYLGTIFNLCPISGIIFLISSLVDLLTHKTVFEFL